MIFSMVAQNNLCMCDIEYVNLKMNFNLTTTFSIFTCLNKFTYKTPHVSIVFYLQSDITDVKKNWHPRLYGHG